MGNAESKKEERSDDIREEIGVNQRAFAEGSTRQKELTSVPVKIRLSDLQELHPSDTSGDERDSFLEEDGPDPFLTLSARYELISTETFSQLTGISPRKRQLESLLQNSETERKLRIALHFNLVRQLYEKFISDEENFGTACIELIAGFIDVRYYEQIALIAESIGFQSTKFETPFCRLTRSLDLPTDLTSRRRLAIENILSSLDNQIDLTSLTALDKAVEEGIAWYLNLEVKTKKDSQMTSNSATVFRQDSRNFILPEVVMEKLFRKVGEDLKLNVETLENGEISLVQFESQDDGSVKTEKAVQKGELVWRRLQHWSTNVRKEKKFNIWAKGLPEPVKTRILEIALEIGFEAAIVQPNGNIHLEIKPPEGQHRRKLKHATDELRKELIPIDEAVCENVEQHLKDWVLEFKNSGKLKDVLNCRFVLPAEWLRTTSEKLAEEHGLKVNMETGIELWFYRADVDLKELQEMENSSKTISSTKKKPKSRKKKQQQSPQIGEGPFVPSLPPSSPLEECTKTPTPTPIPIPKDIDFNTNNNTNNNNSTSSNILAINNNSSKIALETIQSAEVVGVLTTATTMMGDLNQSAELRRAVGRNKCGYGWDPNWPTAQQ